MSATQSKLNIYTGPGDNCTITTVKLGDEIIERTVVYNDNTYTYEKLMCLSCDTKFTYTQELIRCPINERIIINCPNCKK